MFLKEEFSIFFEKAKCLNVEDELSLLRDRYHIPANNAKEKIYLCGNSLGLQPKTAEDYILKEIKQWATLGVEGHFEGQTNWFNFHAQFDKSIAELIGSKGSEIVVANALTVNLHLLFSTFYKPTNKRKKILVESPLFSSDYYALCSQVEHLGLCPEDTLIELRPRDEENCLLIEDILTTIESLGDELALVWFGAVNFYTGQFFDVESITAKAHQVGALAGFDLAHAIGNVPLALHNHKVDFATWCSYKYLNSGPGGISGLFVHENHADISPAFKGWWGVDEAERFKMNKKFAPMPGAKAWQLSNPPILCMAAHKAALDEFEKVDFADLRLKSIALTSLLIEGIDLISAHFPASQLKIITPRNANERGSQVSIFTGNEGETLFKYLHLHDIVADWREPNVIRISPVPMYNSFDEIGKVIHALYEFYNG